MPRSSVRLRGYSNRNGFDSGDTKSQNAWSLWFPPEWSPAVTFGLLFAFLALQPLARLFRERLSSGDTRESLA